jgi:glycosyltransferase involved in cell wall biosynthesis
MRKKICYITGGSGDWGGASRVLNVTLRLLDRSRFEPLVLFPRRGPILADLDRRGVVYRIWGPLNEYAGPLSYIRAIVRAWMFFRRERVALIHINHNHFWRPAEILAAKLARIPIVAHYHVVVGESSPYTKHLNRVITVSDFVSGASCTRGVGKTTIYNTVELERFDDARDVRAELGIPPQAMVISFVGQIRKQKGADLFLQMTREIDDEAVRFLIAGECRDSQRYPDAYTRDQLTTEIASDRRIHYLGLRGDIENIYHSSDIVVMPSRWQEPFGLITIEAGAARRPIVAARVGGIPEVITDGENGLLFEPDDVASLVCAVRRLLENDALRAEIGTRARRRVEKDFTVKPIRKLEMLYDELTQ